VVKYVKKPLSIECTDTWNFIVVKNLLEFRKTQFPRVVCINNFELLLESNQPLGSTGCNPLFKLVNLQLILLSQRRRAHRLGKVLRFLGLFNVLTVLSLSGVNVEVLAFFSRAHRVLEVGLRLLVCN